MAELINDEDYSKLTDEQINKIGENLYLEKNRRLFARHIGEEVKDILIWCISSGDSIIKSYMDENEAKIRLKKAKEINPDTNFSLQVCILEIKK